MEKFVIDKLNDYVNTNKLYEEKETITLVIELILNPFEGNLKEDIVFDYGHVYRAINCNFITKEGYSFHIRYEIPNKGDESVLTFNISYSKNCLYEGWDYLDNWDEHVKKFLKGIQKK